MSLPQDSVLAGMFARRLYFLCLVAQGSPTLCNPMDYRLPRSSVHGILQARTLEWVAISFGLPSIKFGFSVKEEYPQ